MTALRSLIWTLIKLLLFWLILFHVQRLLFSIHNWDKFADISMGEWLLAFVYSFRLDLSTAALLSLPLLTVLTAYMVFPSIWALRIFKGMLILEVLLVTLVHGGEINAYPEWNHKLTTRVFTHLVNPDEVVRTADHSMIVFYVIYTLIELFAAWFLYRKLIAPGPARSTMNWMYRVPLALMVFVFFGAGFIVLGRGGFQQIPINTDAAYYTNSYAANDLSVNSFYFFARSFMLYSRTEEGARFPVLKEAEAKNWMKDLGNYPADHENRILNTEKPNIVFIILESWTANAVGSVSGKKGATPYFDQMAKEGLLFTRMYSTGSTSELGNSSIFSGYPSLPGVSLTMFPDKHRKVPSINQDLKKWGYSSSYLFSGDLKYGNIGGYFIDHGFDVVEDENDFPSGLPKGKLNYYDEDLYRIFKKKLNEKQQPFLSCAFTGSTHSPYDFPQKGTPTWKGKEAKFMTSMYYADKCLYDFIQSSKKEKWYKNTIFVFVADHGHASHELQNPSLAGFYHIPMMIYGEPLKKEFRGKRIEKVASQADIAATLIYQLGGDPKRYPWSKDILNPSAPEFALFALAQGYGWVSPAGNFSYHMDGYGFLEQTMDEKVLKKERKRCHSFMSLVYHEFEKL